MRWLDRVRRPRYVFPGGLLLCAFVMLIAGLMAGLGAKWLDLNCEFLGNLFSRIMIWFVLCTLISVRSESPVQAALNVFMFCAGMLCAYYLAAIWWQVVWGRIFLFGWFTFAICSPLLAYLAWFAGGRGSVAIFLRVGILVVSLAIETMLFGFRSYNILLSVLLALFLFTRRSGRNRMT